MEITAVVLKKKDPETGKFLIEVVRDSAGQKGTGRWTVEAALRYGVPVPTITAAVEARALSAHAEKRGERSKAFPEVLCENGAKYPTPEAVRSSLEAATLVTYGQGFELLAAATTAEQWGLPMSEIARIWRGGCIIRSSLLKLFQQTFADSLAGQKKRKMEILKRFGGERQKNWRSVVSFAAEQGIPAPALSASLSYYDAVRAAQLPQNLIQLQRDYFGAHGFERVGQEGIFHGGW
jgi:6-phosphogluconate dehydrogenase